MALQAFYETWLLLGVNCEAIGGFRQMTGRSGLHLTKFVLVAMRSYN